MPRCYRFNHLVGLDLLQIKDLDGNQQSWLNCVCWGTGYQQVMPLAGAEKTPDTVWATFVACWSRVFGMPKW